MEWINIHSSTIDGETMQDASMEERGIWLSLMRYCVGLENGGLIPGAKAWGDRKWLKNAGLGKEDVEKKSALWRWEGDDLFLEFYPHRQEKIQRSKRLGGAAGGRISGEHRRRKKEASSEGEVEGLLQCAHEGEVEGPSEGLLERKGREGKVMKGKEKGGHTLDCDIPSLEEVRTWAAMSGVDPDFASEKWSWASERHAWVSNGRLMNWRMAFKRYWEDSRQQWNQKKQKIAALTNGATAAAEPGDVAWWWTDPLESVERALAGALLGEDPSQARLRVVVETRKKAEKEKPSRHLD